MFVAKHVELTTGTATGTAWVSLTNSGPAPVTLVGIADHVATQEPGGSFSPFSRMRWGVAPAETGPEGAKLGTGPLRLGLTSVADPPLDRPITVTFATASTPEPGCPDIT
jgi:hypothetical protein